MDYQALLNIAKTNQQFQKIKIEGGQTEGHLLFADTPNKGIKRCPPRKELGKSYARKYQEEDEMEDIRLVRNLLYLKLLFFIPQKIAVFKHHLFMYRNSI